MSMTDRAAPKTSPASSAKATRACDAMTTGANRVSGGRCFHKAASSGAACRSIATGGQAVADDDAHLGAMGLRDLCGFGA